MASNPPKSEPRIEGRGVRPTTPKPVPTTMDLCARTPARSKQPQALGAADADSPEGTAEEFAQVERTCTILPQPNRPIISRPGTLAEAILWSRGDISRLRVPLAGFLDEFYADRNSDSRHGRLRDEPELTGDAKLDAYVGAVGEHLCHRWVLGAPPDWTADERRFLHEAWFLGPERMKPFLLAESPGAFRQRFIFTEAEPLRRASMPRDGRWWFYEELRSGLTPGAGDIDEPCGVRVGA